MHTFPQRTGRNINYRWFATATLLLVWLAPVHAEVPATAGGDARSNQVTSTAIGKDTWGQALASVGRGEFNTAADLLRQAPGGGPLTEQVRTWLDAYQAKEEARKALDLKDFEKYVGYAKARIERKEYALALDKALLAHDVAADQDAFLRVEWLQQLVNDALAHADERKQKSDWRGAWEIYGRLTVLYEKEPRYQKLEREVLTHIRFEALFKEGSTWRERLEKVRWDDAERAIEALDLYYVEPVDFRKITEHGLEQLLYLAESPSAQKSLEGLSNEDDRNDFLSRIRTMLEQVRHAGSVNRAGCAQRLRRAIEINKQTVRVPEELVVSELMRGALEPLDEFTTMIWPKEADEFDKHTRGDFIGVGIQIIKDGDSIKVQTPLDDTPAYRAGIQAGDIIESVDGNSLLGYSLNKVVETITGPKGTPVTLTIRRDGKLMDFPLTRDTIKILSVKGVKRDPGDETRWEHWLDKDNGIAYVRVANFQRNTVEDFVNTLSELQAGNLKGLVLDLRGNPGGLLESAHQLSALFLKKGDKVVSTRGRIAEENQSLSANGTGPYSEIPLVVLVDQSSASASEIVSGAVRDNHRGTVVGTRTFGKFSVQNLIPLGSSRAKLKITTAKYYLPSGASLHRDPTADTWGVEPDVTVRLVNKELRNLWEMRRAADLLGPTIAKLADAEKDDGEELSAVGLIDEEEMPLAEDFVGPHWKADSVGDKNEDGTPKLPPLKQPDENNRPKEDPQLDTALLMLRVGLLGKSHPALAATARTETSRNEAQP